MIGIFPLLGGYSVRTKAANSICA